MHKDAPSSAPVIAWFRQDLRLTDNPSLANALATGAPVIPLFILDDKAAGEWQAGGATRWALHSALHDLDTHLRANGSKLILRRGDSLTILQEIITETKATDVFWNRRYEPWAIAQDIAIKTALTDQGTGVTSINGRLLIEPWEIKNGQKQPYKVFTPYWRTCIQHLTTFPVKPVPKPRALHAPTSFPTSDTLGSWHLLPTQPDWAGGMRATWEMTEHGAHKVLAKFIEDGLPEYSKGRDFPSLDATSSLSPYLALGLISPVTIWHEIQTAMANERIPPKSHDEAEKFLRQLIWREFSYHLLFHFPHTDTTPLNPQFEHFPWRTDAKELQAWQRGQTGYPIVDAGMRQLWQTGWMHNRVRMIVASFLIKHLLLPWQEGAAWFWDTLIDADLANNTMGWQWVAGSGADAAPYFRIFNPMLQSDKFDAAGYIRTYVPELAALPDKFIHAPWTAPPLVLAEAKVALGKTYPKPIVDHDNARARALDALKETKN
jgi:deoxyribodipyrimidine photo-lyase